jgi:hypothetical protein
LEQLRGDWLRHRTPFHAADLLDAALVLDRSDIATDAAEFLLSADVSQLTLGRNGTDASPL